MASIKKVQEFHELFNHPVLDKPAIPSIERCKLRISLLREELKELEEAIENNDVVEAADAFTDLQYVLDGAMLEFGMKNIKCKLFNEVHRSNMSKACVSLQEATATVEHFEKQGQPCHWIQKDLFDSNNHFLETVFLVYRNEDMKLLKSINYSPADLKTIVENEK